MQKTQQLDKYLGVNTFENIWSENSDCYHIKINKRKENMAELIKNLQRYSYGCAPISLFKTFAS